MNLIQSNFLDTNYSKLEKIINKNVAINPKLKMINNSKEYSNNGDTVILNPDNILKVTNMNMRKYMLNTFNKTKIIARNSSGVF